MLLAQVKHIGGVLKMIHIDRETLSDGSIVIKVDGLLNRKTIEPLAEICSKSLKNNLSIFLDLAGVTHTDELGREFLVEVGKHIIFKNVPKFLKIDLG